MIYKHVCIQRRTQALQASEIHAGRKGCSHGDQDDPDQPESDAHLIPGMTPRCERQRQGRPDYGTLLGFELRSPGLPCTISVPNLIADRSG